LLITKDKIKMNRDDIILNYWFNDLNDAILLSQDSLVVKRWFHKSDQTDQEIRQTFEHDLIKAKQGLYSSWENTPRKRLALVILYDQFSRNIYRGTPTMFQFDALALDLTLRSIDEKFDNSLQLIEKAFLYMPLMHSEDLKIQEKSLNCFTALVSQAKQKSKKNIPYFENTLNFAKQHHRIIEKFSRFPHRNVILNRDSAEKELMFLKTPGSSF